jgi:hypothetical protein
VRKDKSKMPLSWWLNHSLGGDGEARWEGVGFVAEISRGTGQWALIKGPSVVRWRISDLGSQTGMGH